MIVPGPPSCVYRCDVCGATARGDTLDFPPIGFATLLVRPSAGAGIWAHLCVGPCLTVGADNLGKGRTVSGDPP